MNQQTNNEAFEKWVTKSIVSKKLKEFSLDKRQDGTYRSEFTRAKYEAWQAARQQPLKRLSEGKIAVIAHESRFQITGSYTQFANAIMDEIERINRE